MTIFTNKNVTEEEIIRKCGFDKIGDERYPKYNVAKVIIHFEDADEDLDEKRISAAEYVQQAVDFLKGLYFCEFAAFV
jgi:hypothetical protein